MGAGPVVPAAPPKSPVLSIEVKDAGLRTVAVPVDADAAGSAPLGFVEGAFAWPFDWLLAELFVWVFDWLFV